MKCWTIKDEISFYFNFYLRGSSFFEIRIFEILCYTERKFLKIYSQNIVVIQYNILKIFNFTMHFNKINQIYFVFYWNFLNE